VLVVERASTLQCGTIDLIPAAHLEKALSSSCNKGIHEVQDFLPALHSAVGKLAILTRALDRLRDELVGCEDLAWLKMQVEFCFDANVESISGKKNISEKEFLKEAAEAHKERFSHDLGDFKKAAAKIIKSSSLSEEKTGQILEGLILSLRELHRDIGIHLTVIGEWVKRCDTPRASVRSIFRTGPPLVTGDGLTGQSPWEFPLSRMQGEGVAMAHEFMASKGPSYRLRKQALVELDDEKIVEYWDTDAGRFWFRYRKDPRIRSQCSDS